MVVISGALVVAASVLPGETSGGRDLQSIDDAGRREGEEEGVWLHLGGLGGA